MFHVKHFCDRAQPAGPITSRHLTGQTGSALVAVGALLGVEAVGGDAKHVVALDADAVKRVLRVLAFFSFGRVRFVGFCSHVRNSTARFQRLQSRPHS